MSPRLPFLTLVGLVVAGGVLASEGSDDAAPAVAVAATSDQTGDATWFCAGGTAVPGGFADHTVVIANAGSADAAGRLTVVPGDIEAPDQQTQAPTSDPASSSRAIAARAGAPAADQVTEPVHLAPGEQVRMRLGDLVEAPLAGAVVEMDEGEVTVDHEVQGPLGHDSAPCQQRGATTWHFAWGATTRDARQMLVLFNPYANDVVVDGVFSTERGVREPLRWQGLSVPAHSVVGVDVADDVTRRDQLSATLQVRGGRLLVDRIQAFDGQLGVTGLSLAAGSPESGPRWAFPDGQVDEGGSERVVLYNPGTVPAEVDVEVHTTGDADAAAGSDQPDPEPFGVVVRPGRFEVLALDQQARVPRATPHAITVQSRNGVPVVAERVSIGPAGVRAEPGQPAVSRAWTFAGAATQRYAVFNPDRTRSVGVTLGVREPGSGVVARSHGVEVGPLGRTELAVPSAGAVVVEADRPVVARPIP